MLNINKAGRLSKYKATSERENESGRVNVHRFFAVSRSRGRIENKIENFIKVSEPYSLGTTPY